MDNFYEEWRDIPEYEGLYQASNLGRVRSLPRTTTSGRIIKPYNNPHNGYVYVTLSKNNRRIGKRLHRLVIGAFNGESELQVNHIDGDKRNNKLDNLEYCTQSENMKHAYKLGLEKKKGIPVICLDDKQVYETASSVFKDRNRADKILRVCRGELSHYKGRRYATLNDYISGTIPEYKGKFKKGVSENLWQ